MTHPSVEEIAEHLEGVLTTDTEHRVLTHLAECAECAATMQTLAAAPARLRAAAAPPPPMPDDVAARIDAALADEARRRSGTAGPAPAVDDLEARRRRRRRALAGGLLAAAAATVVVVGVGEMLSTGGSADQSAAESTARKPAVAGGPRQPGALDDRSGGQKNPQAPSVASLGPEGTGGLRPREVTLVESTAAAHHPGQARHERAGCVDAALGAPATSQASYAVRLPVGAGTGPGVVVLRPNDSPAQGVLVACAPRPRVLLRHDLTR